MERLGQMLNIPDFEKRVAKMKEIAAERESTEIIHLPPCQEGKRSSPNSFLRSALFAAIQSKDRVYLENTTLFSQQGITVKFTGKQLNQEDMTVWLSLLDLARLHPLGNECDFTAYGILKHMGLNDGGDQRERLHTNINRLTDCTVRIETSRMEYGGHLIDEYKVDKETKHYKITLNKKLIHLFGENDWTAINWEQRKQLRQKPLASKLHEYYSSHQHPKSVTFDFLHNITGSDNKAKRSFKVKVKAALEALVKIGFLSSYKVEEDLVTVERKNTHTLPIVKARQ